MGLKGTFKDFSISDIVQLIQLQKKTGKLTVEADGRHWLLGFQGGLLVQASARANVIPRLGEILMRHGVIDRDTLATALRAQDDSGQHLGQVLEEMGKVDHGQIARALNFQVQETALNLFFHPRGEYTFERVPISFDTEYLTPVNTEYVLMEGARRVDEWPAIRRVIGGGDSVFERHPEADLTQAATRPEGDQAVLTAVDGSQDVSALVRGAGLGIFETCRILTVLLSDGLIRPVTLGGAPIIDPVGGPSFAGETNATTSAPAEADLAVPDAHEKKGGVLRWFGIGSAAVVLATAAWFSTGAS